MSTLEFNLKALIAKATEEYTAIATKDPVIASEDDDTTRGEELDRLLAKQELERKELWDQLYAVGLEVFFLSERGDTYLLLLLCIA